MTDMKIYEQWRILCKEHEIARDAYFKAFDAVDSKLIAIAQGTSDTNPNEKELFEFEKTRQTWEDIKKRMSAFVKKNA